jgi:hypothetical protein
LSNENNIGQVNRMYLTRSFIPPISTCVNGKKWYDDGKQLVDSLRTICHELIDQMTTIVNNELDQLEKQSNILRVRDSLPKTKQKHVDC